MTNESLFYRLFLARQALAFMGALVALLCGIYLWISESPLLDMIPSPYTGGTTIQWQFVTVGVIALIPAEVALMWLWSHFVRTDASQRTFRRDLRFFVVSVLAWPGYFYWELMEEKEDRSFSRRNEAYWTTTVT